MKRVVFGALIGALPGLVLILLAALVSGEAELTLGVTGIFVAIMGLVIGAIVGAIKRVQRTAKD